MAHGPHGPAQPVRWFPERLEMLGKMPDAVVARRIGASTMEVWIKRRSLGIAAFDEESRKRESRISPLRGGVTRGAEEAPASGTGEAGDVGTRKRRPATPAPPWTEAERNLLGTLPDRVVAEKTGRSEVAVTLQRRKRRISARNPCRRWTSAETDLLGKLLDHEVAERTDRTVSSVMQKRMALRIRGVRAANPHSQWTSAELDLLGTLPDEEVAKRTGKSVAAVVHMRRTLRIAAQNPHRWTSAELELLRTLPDRFVAERTGRGVRAIRAKRWQASVRNPFRRWTSAELDLLGTLPDAEVAERTRRTVEAVEQERRKLGILPCANPPASATNEGTP